MPKLLCGEGELLCEAFSGAANGWKVVSVGLQVMIVSDEFLQHISIHSGWHIDFLPRQTLLITRNPGHS